MYSQFIDSFFQKAGEKLFLPEHTNRLMLAQGRKSVLHFWEQTVDFRFWSCMPPPLNMLNHV